jgi:hypothetical protein
MRLTHPSLVPTFGLQYTPSRSRKNNVASSISGLKASNTTSAYGIFSSCKSNFDTRNKSRQVFAHSQSCTDGGNKYVVSRSAALNRVHMTAIVTIWCVCKQVDGYSPPSPERDIGQMTENVAIK